MIELPSELTLLIRLLIGLAFCVFVVFGFWVAEKWGGKL